MASLLLVDDNLELAENVSEILRDRGDEVDVATEGLEALRLLKGRRYDVLITDMKMPGMTGAQLVHEARSVDPGLPVIALTAYTSRTDLRTARNDGLLAVLGKPPPLPLMFELLSAARRDGIVALVEDDEALSDNLCEAMRARGFTAVTANTLIEATRLGNIRPFAAVVDLVLPGGPYGEVMNHLDKRFPGLPQVVITAHREVSLPKPPHRIFYKPFDTGQLLSELEKLYAQKTKR
ncbi:MAG: response regulator [Myxococcales bacterium]|nr:response regulator [Myxococcales bacterium]